MWRKQTPKVKSFLSASAHAVKTQIWTALIAMLILKYLQMKSSFGWSLSNLAALLRQWYVSLRSSFIGLEGYGL
jgi:hypothetical protein